MQHRFNRTYIKPGLQLERLGYTLSFLIVPIIAVGCASAGIVFIVYQLWDNMFPTLFGYTIISLDTICVVLSITVSGLVLILLFTRNILKQNETMKKLHILFNPRRFK